MRGLGLATIMTAAGVVLLGALPAAASGWMVVPSPPSGGGFFNAVSARTDTDAWVVGDLSATTPLTARWNGTSWSQVTGPTVTGARNTVLNAVSAASASDAWAVGRATVNLVTSSLAAHWNGSAWSVVATPQVAGSVLTSVADISPADAYAVGQSEALHWNGTDWSAFGVPVPGGGTPAGLSAVAADSASDVWIAGEYFDSATSALEPFTAHWNGTSWATVPVPASGAELTGLAVINHADAWVVGIGPKGKAVTENWTGGRAWHLVPNPVSGLLLSVTGTGPGNVTAAGHNTTPNGPTAAIILSWNGSTWTKVKVPKVGATEELDSASTAPGGTITWSFGRSTNREGVVSNLTLRNG
jgi:hypothetical protein